MKRTLITLLSIVLAIGIFTGCSDEEKSEATYDSFDIQTVQTVLTAANANPEIIRMVPGSNSKAVFVSSQVNSISVIDYTPTNFTISNTYQLNPGSATSEMTSIDISPKMNGENYVAVCVAEVDCSPGWILFVKLSDGSIVKKVTGIGYNPDGCAFTKNGDFLIVACEDDREDRECKPADRNGGSVSIIDLRNGIANATLSQDFKVDWATDSEPEHCETSDDGTVIVSVQETSEIIIFNTSDLPLTRAKITVVSLPDDGNGNEAEPDGLYISPNGEYALISNERNGTFQMMSLPDGMLYGSPTIVENDLPGGWQVDARKSTKRTEPEECSLVEKSDKLYAILALQESHAVVVYDVTDPANPVFDSIAEAGNDWVNDVEMKSSSIGSEGLSAHPTNGMVFSANEREGSVTMYRAQWATEK